MKTTHERRKPRRKGPPRSRRTAIGSLIEAARARRTPAHTRAQASREIGCVHSTLANWEERGLRPLAAYTKGIAAYVGLTMEEVERMRGQLRKGAR
jgi:hypothetical protein